MYSWEIDELMRISNYYISSDAYLKINAESPQVIRVKYEPFNDNFEMETNDGYQWRFKVFNG